MSEFNGSIAQVNVQFPIETVIQPIAGAAYSRTIIYMPLAQATVYLPGLTSVSAGQMVTLDSSSYASITGGLLKSWLLPFFTKATTAIVYVAVYDEDTTTEVEGEQVTTPATAPIEALYESTKYLAYFKFGIAGSDAYNALQQKLAQLCLPDELYSQHWVGTDEANVLTASSALITLLTSVNADSRVIYNPDSTINPALAQLGATLSVVNSTGTPVGNSTDMVGFNTISASGALDEDGNRLNLTATQKTALDNQKIGYDTWVGDGTENVSTEGSMTLKGTVVGARWVKNYIEYLCKIRTATFLTGINRFRNNSQYQAILLIVSDEAKAFVDMGRLENFKLTAPTFANLPTSADGLTVANAWEADYVDTIRTVTVYGTLYVTQPSK